MKGRREARIAVLQALYQCESLSSWESKDIDTFFLSFYKEEEKSNEVAIRHNLEFAKQEIQDIIKEIYKIDELIEKSLTNWNLETMNRIDRNILRIAVYEILYLDDIPVKVSINEAIEIAKIYGGEESPQFVNGVLDKIVKISA